MAIVIGGKQKRVKRLPTIDGMDVDEFIRRNALPDDLEESADYIGSWTRADAHLEIDGVRKPVYELILGSGGPLLPASAKTGCAG